MNERITVMGTRNQCQRSRLNSGIGDVEVGRGDEVRVGLGILEQGNVSTVDEETPS